MRDIGARISRYRLSRYAPPEDRLRRRLRWAWVAFALWAVWVGLLSEHSFLRLWSLGREDTKNRAEQRRLTEDLASLEHDIADPQRRRLAAEDYLRHNAQMARKNEIVYQYSSPRAGRPDP